MADLKNPAVIKLKGALFLLLGLISGGLLLAGQFSLTAITLLAICIWAFCRSYYFAFYVLHHYVDPNFTYTGLADLIRYLVKNKDESPSG